MMTWLRTEKSYSSSSSTKHKRIFTHKEELKQLIAMMTKKKKDTDTVMDLKVFHANRLDSNLNCVYINFHNF